MPNQPLTIFLPLTASDGVRAASRGHESAARPTSGDDLREGEADKQIAKADNDVSLISVAGSEGSLLSCTVRRHDEAEAIEGDMRLNNSA